MRMPIGANYCRLIRSSSAQPVTQEGTRSMSKDRFLVRKLRHGLVLLGGFLGLVVLAVIVAALRERQ